MLYFSRWKSILIWLTVVLGVAYAAPNLFPAGWGEEAPAIVPHKRMPLGLDLQGGSHILLKLERADLVTERLVTVRDDVRRVLRDAKIGYTGLSATGESVQVRIRDAAQAEEARKAIDPLLQPVSAGLFGGAITELELAEPEAGLLRLTLTEAGLTYRTSAAISQSIEVVSRRVNELGTTEPLIQRQGEDRILVQVPGLQDPQRLKDILGQTAKLTFQFVDTTVSVEEALNGRPPAGSSLLYSMDDPPVPYLIEDRVIVSGEELVDAQATTDQRTGEWVVSFRFDTKGAARFGQATQENVGRLFAIVLDRQVISAPRIQEPILGGSGQITGNFTADSATNLAVLLRAGALPATLTVIEERTVGPGLGADSISAGKFASAIAGVLVIVFMLLAYGWLGVIANVALFANVAMIVAILSVLGATLTLPGIAGIVLTVGMAVDSNVLIFERVREERRLGKSLIQSMDQGFARALATIVDSNLTTLIAAAVLFWLGSGPVKGFAVTLAIGIVTTVFTAFTFTRLLVAYWVRVARPKEMPRGILKLVPDNTTVPFMRWRMAAFVISGALTIGALSGFVFKEMNFGIDFRGGSIIEVQAKDGTADVGAIRAALADLNLGDVQVQSFGNPADVLIRVESQGEGENSEQTVVLKVRDALDADYEFRRVEVVGPTVSGELARNGTIGVIVALVAILIYIWFRFEWQFAVGAILATLHDVIMTIGFFVFTGIEFNLSSIAAILTILGYSLNDTVVVYDRVRENLRKYKSTGMLELLDLSMNQTLSRTVLTGVTTLLALAALYLFGGEVIASFVLAMIFGILVGTYSSIFVAGPLLNFFRLRGTPEKQGRTEKAAEPEQVG
ncbi:MAG: protein translocase subunit SecDF [Rhizobiaceae bacterium]